MVAHHEVAVVGNRDFGQGTVVAKLGRNVGLVQQRAVDVNLALVDAKPVAGQGDDALDVAFFLIARIAEDHDVAALDQGEVVDHFVDEEPVAVFQLRQHAGAFDAHRLVEKGDDENRGGGGDEQVAQPEGETGGSARGHALAWRQVAGSGGGIAQCWSLSVVRPGEH